MLRTTVAAVLGGAVAGALFLEDLETIARPVCGALLGFLVEAVHLYLTALRHPGLLSRG